MNIEALASFLRDIGASLFADLVALPHEADTAERLATWSRCYRDKVRKHGGVVEHGLATLAPVMLAESVNILYSQ